MADDFFGPPTDAAADVPAEIQIDGQVTEINTGEQVADEGGNATWWDETYPGQITNTAANPTQDAYGLNILSAAETKDLTRNINPAFINSFVDPNTPTTTTATNAVNKTAAPLPAFVDSAGVAFDPVTFQSYPVVNGKQVIPTDVLAATDPAARNRLEIFNRTPYTSATPVNPGQSNLAGPPDTFIKDANGDWQPNPKYPVNISAAPVSTPLPAVTTNTQPTTTSAAPVYTPSPYTETRQTAVDAARLNAYSETPNPYLTNIEKAGAEIAKGQAGIATANQTIQSAQQKIIDSESYIAQNNAELANPNISAERRAQLEANNAAQVQNVLDQTQSINENQAYITNTQDVIDANNVVINDNAAVYRDSTNPAITTTVPINVDPNVTAAQTAAAVASPTRTATPVDATTLEGYGVNEVGATVSQPFGSNPDAEAEAAAAAQVGRQLAQQQAVNAAQKRVVNNSDWRVRLQLAPGANYLYNAPTGPGGGGPGILWPLKQTDGVIFPYTPKIMMNYKADYEAQILTHSNYKGYFYKGSYADAVTLNAVFTAQDTLEAAYLLAVIHFFRSVTKMFYGQDPNRGAPPPLVYLTGLGEFQFTQHPCVVANFNYSLPSDVDYIRARSINVNGTDLTTRRDKQSLPTNPISGAVGRLQNLFSSQGINKGAVFYPPPTPNLGQNQPTYVPTKMEIDLTLYPMQSRQQVSKVFDNRQYNNGAQLKGGFW